MACRAVALTIAVHCGHQAWNRRVDWFHVLTSFCMRFEGVAVSSPVYHHVPTVPAVTPSLSLSIDPSVDHSVHFLLKHKRLLQCRGRSVLSMLANEIALFL